MQIREALAKRKRGPYRKSYELSDMENAFSNVVNGHVSVKRAAKVGNVPETTLRDRVKGRIGIETLKSGVAPLFSLEEEAFLASHVITMGEIGYGYTRSETLNLASDYAVHLGYRDRQHPRTHFWLYSFIDRHPQLKVQKPCKLEFVRAKSATSEAISAYFRELSTIMQKYGFQNNPQSIYNIDEKGLSTDVAPGKVVAGVHCKPQAVTSGKSKNVTMIGAVSATGASIPPFFVFPGKRMRPDLLEGATPGVQATVTETGWSNTEVFADYMKNHFLKFVPDRTDASPLLVLYDGHKSHVSLPLIKWAQDNHIVLFVLPPHCSHLLQPLDVGCFGPYELRWKGACHAHLRESNGKVITRYDVCGIACKVHSSTLTPSNIMSSFRKTGIYPLKVDVVPDTAIAPSTVFQKIVPENTAVPAPDTFLANRGGHLLENATAAKVRKTLSRVVGGKAITEAAKVDQIRDHINAQSKKRKSSPTDIQVAESGLEETQTQTNIGKGKGASSGKNKWKGKRRQKKAKQSTQKTDGAEGSESEDDGARCCVCGKFTPTEKKKKSANGINIVSWAQCDSCDHWTHLSFCTQVSQVNNDDMFYCPHCPPHSEE